MPKVQNRNDGQHASNLQSRAWPDRGRDEVEDAAQQEDCKVQCGEVMMEEELSPHEEEGEVVEGPANE